MKNESSNKQTPSDETEVTKYDIPIEGSLGIMATGYIGIQLWRRKILGVKKENPAVIGPVVFGRAIPMINRNDEKK